MTFLSPSHQFVPVLVPPDVPEVGLAGVGLVVDVVAGLVLNTSDRLIPL